MEIHGTCWDIPRSFIKTSDGTLYVGDNHGIYMSVDGGDTWWTSWDSPHAGVTVVNGFVELDDGTLFACLTDASVYHIGVIRSTDHGGTWHSIGLDSNYFITFAKSREGNIYAGCSGYNSDEHVGVFRTVDNGETWEMLNGDYLSPLMTMTMYILLMLTIKVFAVQVMAGIVTKALVLVWTI